MPLLPPHPTIRAGHAPVVLGFACMLMVGEAWGQAPKKEALVLGEVHHVPSQALGQDRTINVYLPDGYTDTLRYPVVYVLDGSANEDFVHVAGLVQFLSMYALMPPSIVVGIANVDRRHDFTAPTQDDSDKVWVPNSGGSAAFIDFIGRELLPYVDRHFHTNGQRTIIGQSLGGLLATEILFTRPELFTDYVLVSPSLWWNKGALAASAPEKVRGFADRPLRVYIAAAPDDAMMQPQIDHVVSTLKEQTRAPFRWWYVPFPEESHLTILHRAVYKAFEVMNAGQE